MWQIHKKKRGNHHTFRMVVLNALTFSMCYNIPHNIWITSCLKWPTSAKQIQFENKCVKKTCYSSLIHLTEQTLIILFYRHIDTHWHIFLIVHWSVMFIASYSNQSNHYSTTVQPWVTLNIQSIMICPHSKLSVQVKRGLACAVTLLYVLLSVNWAVLFDKSGETKSWTDNHDRKTTIKHCRWKCYFIFYIFLLYKINLCYHEWLCVLVRPETA